MKNPTTRTIPQTGFHSLNKSTLLVSSFAYQTHKIEKPTPENQFQTRPIPIVLTDRNRFGQHCIHVESFRPHECFL